MSRLFGSTLGRVHRFFRRRGKRHSTTRPAPLRNEFKFREAFYLARRSCAMLGASGARARRCPGPGGRHHRDLASGALAPLSCARSSGTEHENGHFLPVAVSVGSVGEESTANAQSGNRTPETRISGRRVPIRPEPLGLISVPQ
jgi:hypothetical protein